MRFFFSALCSLLLFCSIPESSIAQSIRVKDLGLKMGFQDTTFGYHKRGRACVAADFNLDGYVDFYIGNPGDESYILENVSAGANRRKFDVRTLPLDGELTWGAVSFDYDNDGDYDLFIAAGGTEGIAYDYLFRNEWIPEGSLSFTDVSEEAGIQGIVPDGESEPIMTGSANAVTADYDGDGDIFVNGNWKSIPGYQDYMGRNTLWRNNGNGTFSDLTVTAGLAEYRHGTRHSTFFDSDNDGDPDLYENNFFGCNVLWRNNADGTFTDVTSEMSLPGEDLSDPASSFASASADFNNDGWEDLLVFMRGRGRSSARVAGTCDCSSCGSELPLDNVECDGMDQYPMGHALFLNQQGAGFVNVGDIAGINDDYVVENGVMGCQVGDVNGDGTPDIYIGNGGPPSGAVDRLYVSTSEFGAPIPVYTNETAAIDFPAQVPAGYPVPPYPYRTHGTAFVDVDNNGMMEIAVSNGGPVAEPDIVREPDRLFTVSTMTPFSYLKIRPVGDGVAVSKDGVGTRIRVTANNPLGEQKVIHKTLTAGSAFSAQNGFEVFFGLGESTVLESISIDWPNGMMSSFTEGLTLNSSIVIELETSGTARIALTRWGESEDLSPVESSESVTVGQNYPNPFNPSTHISYNLKAEGHVTLEVFNVLGERVRVLVDQVQQAGVQAAEWDGRNNSGQPVASGLYLYKVTSGSDVIVRKMLLSK